MPSNNKIYGQQDIQRYINGTMAMQEMHALEMQALEDPLLADAIEGYLVHQNEINITQDLAALNLKLNHTLPNVHPLPKTNWKKYAIAAATIIGISTLGLLYITQYHAPKDANQIANKTLPNTDSITALNQVDKPNNDSVTKVAISKAPQYISPEKLALQYNNTSTYTTIPSQAIASNTATPTAAAPTNDIANSAIEKLAPTTNDDSTISRAKENENTGSLVRKAEADAVEVKAPTVVQREVAVANQSQQRVYDIPRQSTNVSNATINATNPNNETFKIATDDTKQQNNVKRNVLQNYKFNYTITNTTGVAIPYTQVVVPAEALTTYTRVDGTLALISTSNVLNVTLQAAGYKPLQVTLNHNKGNSAITLTPTNASQDAVVNTGYTKAKKTKNVNADNITGEPVYGATTYNMYLANNKSNTIQPKGTVIVSFIINKLGDPKNIIVTKSLSTQANDDAIKLVANGPKWVYKKRKSNTATVAVTY